MNISKPSFAVITTLGPLHMMKAKVDKLAVFKIDAVALLAIRCQLLDERFEVSNACFAECVPVSR